MMYPLVKTDNTLLPSLGAIFPIEWLYGSEMSHCQYCCMFMSIVMSDNFIVMSDNLILSDSIVGGENTFNVLFDTLEICL